jgi:Metallopeptidase family M24
MGPISASLIAAQNKTAAFVVEVVDRGMIQAGKLESELTVEIHSLARSRFGLRRHWHKHIVRSGLNTLLTYYDDPADRRITAHDIDYLDFGPVFDENATVGRAAVSLSA